ncbi:GDP-mannose transporter 1 [Gracilariopsis chorda]|uniref:GDP-mannose transporter 1 n=1 Tax=Gracilariopsis chorda TaxID=448386 RepID=A0A2V3IZL3_9FLOR|nr:GDP-mannose transporter 1 [Gracilariopsis chorda]|eukprot:PXF47493.1 GDP-mannose transporter 1 [Gracilariopsis chorda]
MAQRIARIVIAVAARFSWPLTVFYPSATALSADSHDSSPSPSPPPAPPPLQRSAVANMLYQPPPSHPFLRSFPLTPVLAALAYVTTSTSLTLANKLIFSHSLDYPWALLSFQSLGVTLILSVFQLCRRVPPVSLALLRQIFLPCVLFTLYIFTNARALRSVSLPVLSVLKSMAPMGIALAERALFSDPIAPSTAFAMVLIIAANAVTALNDLDYHLSGYVCALLNVVVNIFYVLSLRACLSDKFTPLQKTLHANLVAATLLLPLAVVNRQLIPFIEQFPTTSLWFRHVFVLSSVLAAAIGIAIFWLVSVTSGSTLSFLGACNKFSVVLLGAVLFNTNISPLGWVSVIAGVMAGVLFAISKGYHRPPPQLSPKQLSPSQKHSSQLPETVIDMHAECEQLQSPQTQQCSEQP